MYKIKFGTDGWRAVIADQFTVDNITRVSWAISQWLQNKHPEPIVVVGYDTRFGGKMFAETVAKVLAIKGTKVLLAPDFVSTPMVSLGVLQLKAHLGIMITASHNPPVYNGIKLKGVHGGPLEKQELQVIEGLIPDSSEINLLAFKWDESLQHEKIRYADLEQLYYKHIINHFDIETLKKRKFKIAFDAMYGAGQRILPRILPDVVQVHCHPDPMFGNIPPEPVPGKLMEFIEILKRRTSIDIGIAVDGDADRIALVDKKGRYVDSHHIILLLIHYLAGYKKMKGKVVTGFSTTVKAEVLCQHYGLEIQRVPIGFKEISAVMKKEPVLVGGEESGGISILTHIPERDGIWMGLTILEAMSETGKSLRELIDEVYKITGSFAYARADLQLGQDKIQAVMKRCMENGFDRFGPFEVSHTIAFDGYKFFFNDHEWLMIRASGTEPLLRTYAEAETPERVDEILKAAYETMEVV
ncbi:MAG: phosphoglucomutase/phosphomannomutase family protein [Chlorobi bacterium]|nr:phosphoglucomutase/phosphomannomutase family protein [Chlorobiota bacterium]